jgi:hypothetical protein
LQSALKCFGSFAKAFSSQPSAFTPCLSLKQQMPKFDHTVTWSASISKAYGQAYFYVNSTEMKFASRKDGARKSTTR